MFDIGFEQFSLMGKNPVLISRVCRGDDDFFCVGEDDGNNEFKSFEGEKHGRSESNEFPGDGRLPQCEETEMIDLENLSIVR